MTLMTKNHPIRTIFGIVSRIQVFMMNYNFPPRISAKKTDFGVNPISSLCVKCWTMTISKLVIATTRNLFGLSFYADSILIKQPTNNVLTHPISLSNFTLAKTRLIKVYNFLIGQCYFAMSLLKPSTSSVRCFVRSLVPRDMIFCEQCHIGIITREGVACQI